jgi:hypothetical protein
MIPANGNIPGRLLQHTLLSPVVDPSITGARAFVPLLVADQRDCGECVRASGSREISELARFSSAGILAGASALTHALEVITIAAALRHILAPQTLGKHPRAELLRRRGC